MFITEKLYTPEGGFVAEVVVPKFLTKPEVLIWGSRVFVHIDSLVPDESNTSDIPVWSAENSEGCYMEAFGYYVPPTVEELPVFNAMSEMGIKLEDTAPELPVKDHYESRGNSFYDLISNGLATIKALGIEPNGIVIDLEERAKPPAEYAKEYLGPDSFGGSDYPDVRLGSFGIAGSKTFKYFEKGDPFKCAYCFFDYNFNPETCSQDSSKGYAFCSSLCAEKHENQHLRREP